MRIAIVGAGSLGLLFASKLSAVSEHIIVVTRTIEQANTLRESGITLVEEGHVKVNSDIGRISYESYEASIASMEVGGMPGEMDLDYLFLMVKQPAITPELMAYVKTRMSSGTIVVCFQNGVGHEKRLGQALGMDRLLLAVTTEAARREGPAAVAHTGHGVTYIGSLASESGPKQNLKILLIDFLEKAGITAILSKNMEIRVWNKLIMNAVINPLTAILRVRNGELLNSPWALSLMRELFEEASLVAAAQGVVLPDDLWETLLGVCEATAQNHSSMLQDLKQAKGTEIDSMNGSLLQMAIELKLMLPVHQTVYGLVKALE
ncbi:ketopantoate reductase family protein [Paenibacillus sp. SI8]|uniref:ketopantoate reductase family protein n=1 Tax=unclassified Paenibacillus TaxID=185978 RepID=UPI003465153A